MQHIPAMYRRARDGVLNCTDLNRINTYAHVSRAHNVIRLCPSRLPRPARYGFRQGRHGSEWRRVLRRLGRNLGSCAAVPGIRYGDRRERLSSVGRRIGSRRMRIKFNVRLGRECETFSVESPSLVINNII